jgi:hypothetical protein
MNVVLTRSMRIAVSVFTLVIGAMVLGWAVSADSETPALPVFPPAVLSPVPKMPSRTLASNFEAIVERPLFSQTRKPAPPKPPPAAAEIKQEPPPPPLAGTLLGIVISPSVRSAVVRLTGGKTVTVAEGEFVDGWELKRVMPDLAQFQNNAATVELSFPIHQALASQANPSAAQGALVRRKH